jgi:guanylate kinase
MTKGNLIIISSPSGGGKGTLISEVRRMLPDLGYSCSHTTRPQRAGEVEGREYFFISKDEFEQRIAAGDFLEYANVHGHFYGTSLAESRKVFNTGRDLVVEVDVQGALQIMGMGNLRDSRVSIFILPPSFEVLRARLTSRKTETEEGLRIRLRNSFEEVLKYKKFDYIIVNEDLVTAASQLAAIIVAERQSRNRQASAIRGILDSFDAARHLFEGD